MAKKQKTLGNLGVGTHFVFQEGQPTFVVTRKSGDKVWVKLAGVVGAIAKVFGAPEHEFSANTTVYR